MYCDQIYNMQHLCSKYYHFSMLKSMYSQEFFCGFTQSRKRLKSTSVPVSLAVSHLGAIHLLPVLETKEKVKE